MFYTFIERNLLSPFGFNALKEIEPQFFVLVVQEKLVQPRSNILCFALKERL